MENPKLKELLRKVEEKKKQIKLRSKVDYSKFCKDCGINERHLKLPRCKDCNRKYRKEKGYDKRSYRNAKVKDEDVCIYAIYDDEKVYIGSTCDWDRRRREHAYSISGMSHHKTMELLDVKNLKWMKLLTAEQDKKLRDDSYRKEKEKMFILTFQEKYPQHNLINIMWNSAGEENEF